APPPFAFVATDPDSRNPLARRDFPPGELLELAREGLTLAHGGELDPAAFATYARCARALPPGGRVMTAASLAPRGRNELRMDAPLPHHSIAPWLDAIEWPGDRAQLDTLLDLLGPGRPRDNVELDLGERVGPVLGVLYEPMAAGREARSWEPIFARL